MKIVQHERGKGKKGALAKLLGVGSLEVYKNLFSLCRCLRCRPSNRQVANRQVAKSSIANSPYMLSPLSDHDFLLPMEDAPREMKSKAITSAVRLH
eukprot:scaffold7973_cov315-Pinguiococcus_pyrenoidosus.AAC.1